MSKLLVSLLCHGITIQDLEEFLDGDPIDVGKYDYLISLDRTDDAKRINAVYEEMKAFCKETI